MGPDADPNDPRSPRPHPSRLYRRLSAGRPVAGRRPEPTAARLPEAGLGLRDAIMPTVYRVDTSRSLVALTFDDGPDPVHTPAKLRTLAEHGATATFFILGTYVDGRPELVPATVAAGHEVGNHTYGHPDLTGLSYAGVLAQLEETKRAILRAGGPPTTLFRPPYGFFSDTVLAAAAGDGYRLNVIWDIDPTDWRRPPAPTIVGHVLSCVQPGSIILLHDWVPQTTEALPGILVGLRARGLRAVTVSALLKSSAIPGPAPGPAPAPPDPSPAPPEHRRKCRILRVETPLLRGDDVTAVQRALRGRGLDPGPVDGVFGPRTAAAVRRFQAGQGLAVTGVVAEAEYRRLGLACRA